MPARCTTQRPRTDRSGLTIAQPFDGYATKPGTTRERVPRLPHRDAEDRGLLRKFANHTDRTVKKTFHRVCSRGWSEAVTLPSEKGRVVLACDSDPTRQTQTSIRQHLFTTAFYWLPPRARTHTRVANVKDCTHPWPSIQESAFLNSYLGRLPCAGIPDMAKHR
jgi:hypothetical protein